MSRYHQCDMSQGTTRTRAYIEERGAVVGRLVEITEDGYSGLWRVDSVGQPGIEREELRERQRLNRNSLPSIIDQKAVTG